VCTFGAEGYGGKLGEESQRQMPRDLTNRDETVLSAHTSEKLE